MFSYRLSMLVLVLLLGHGYCDDPELVFRADGGVIEMGYCFGVDYIVIYRQAPDGDKLLGNSSLEGASPSLPPDFKGRVSITNYQQLLGLQIKQLRLSDSGLYRRECWEDGALVKQHKQQLSVCGEELEPQEIEVLASGEAQLLCNDSRGDLQGVTVRWYYEVHPSYHATLFLDTAESLEPLVKDLQGAVEVQLGGLQLLVPDSVLRTSSHFYCLLMERQSCLSFRNLYLPDVDDVQAVFAAEGERLELECLSGHQMQRWDTPLGPVNSSTKRLPLDQGGSPHQIHITEDEESGSFHLVIPSFSDKMTGEYSCFSPALVAEYSLAICPKQDPKDVTFLLGEDALLGCEVGTDEPHKVQWHRRPAGGSDSLILDSKDQTVPIPEDLRGRVSFRRDTSSLLLSDLKVEDGREYWCLLLGSPEFLDNDLHDDEEEEDEGDYADDSDYDDNQDWPEVYRCISKQVSILSVAVQPKDDIQSPPVLPEEDVQPPTVPSHGDGRSGSGVADAEPSPEPDGTDNTIAYVLGVGVAGLAVAGGIAAVIMVRKKKRKTDLAAKAGEDREMGQDIGCTQLLNPEPGRPA